MKRLNIFNIQQMKKRRPIVCLTSYTNSMTLALEQHVDILLVGDGDSILSGAKSTVEDFIHSNWFSSASVPADTLLPEMIETYQFDAIVIGAGIVGLAVAQKLSEDFDDILIVEKENSFGKHVSRRRIWLIWYKYRSFSDYGL